MEDNPAEEELRNHVVNNIEKTFARFSQHCQDMHELRLFLESPERNGFIDLIIHHYSESQRHYHTLRHVYDLLILFDRHAMADNPVEVPIKDKMVIYFSILFHDIIYDPKSKSNEEDSVVVMETMLQSAFPQYLICEIRDYILCTKSHSLPTTKTLDQDYTYLKIFLDFDLSILGSSKVRYQQYMQEIRREYCHVEEKDYLQGRSNVLKSFLHREFLYFTPWIRDMYENAARSNLSFEIDHLEGQLKELAN